MAKKVKKKSKSEELQMAFKWINSLSHEKAELIRTFADWRNKGDINKIIASLEICISAAVIDELEDLDLETVGSIRNKLVSFLEDSNKVMAENKERYGGLEMAIKKINEQEELVKKRVNELINEGAKQKEMVKILSLEFPMLSKAMITNSIKRIKSEKLKDTEDAAKYILEDNKKIKEKIMINAKEIAKKVVDNLEEELEKEDQVIERDQEQVQDKAQEEVKEKKSMSRLKFRRIEVDGEFGSYVREGNKVVAGDITFNSLDEAENYYKKEIEVLTNKIEEVKEVYSI